MLRWSLLSLLLLLPQDPDWEKLRAQIDKISSDDAAERAEARKAIEKLDKDLLMRGFRAKEHRETAALALGVLGDEKAKDALVEMTKSKDAALRAAAFEALGGMKSAESVMAKALGDEPRVAFAAARALARTSNTSRLWSIYTTAAGEVRLDKLQTRTRALAAAVAADAVYPGFGANACVAALEDRDPTFVSAALLGLWQMETLEPLKQRTAPMLARLRNARTRKDLSDTDRERAGLLLLRSGLAVESDLAGMLTDPSALLRERAIKALTPKEPAKKDVGRWLSWLENDAIARDYSKLIESWIAKATGTDPGGDRTERLKVWKQWWTTHQETVFQDSVTKSIEAGVKWLRDNPARGLNSGQAGLVALCLYTMLKSGVGPNDEAVKPSLAWLLKQPLDGVYYASLAAMAFTEAATQWRKEKETDPDLGAKYRRRAVDAAAYLVCAQTNNGCWGYKPGDGWGDNSNAQFAILGLRAAQNGDAKIPENTWKRAAAYLSKSQMSDGGWGYTSEAAYGSMTAAGLCGLLIARSTEKNRAPGDLLADKDVARALKWLEENWTMEGHLYKNGGVGSGIGSAYYWLWSLERCCLVTGVKKIGTHDWYREGAEYIMALQEKTGLWTGSEGVADHCFALLFLKRAFVDVQTEGAKGKASKDVATEGGKGK